MEKEHINFWYREADFLLAFEIYRMMCEEANKNEPTVSIDLVIGRDHGKGSFIASITINVRFTSGRNITKIFRLAHF